MGPSSPKSPIIRDELPCLKATIKLRTPAETEWGWAGWEACTLSSRGGTPLHPSHALPRKPKVPVFLCVLPSAATKWGRQAQVCLGASADGLAHAFRDAHIGSMIAWGTHFLSSFPDTPLTQYHASAQDGSPQTMFVGVVSSMLREDFG